MYTLGFNGVWLGHGMGSYDGFMSILKQRLYLYVNGSGSITSVGEERAN